MICSCWCLKYSAPKDPVWQQLDRLCDRSPLCAPRRLAAVLRRDGSWICIRRKVESLSGWHVGPLQQWLLDEVLSLACRWLFLCCGPRPGDVDKGAVLQPLLLLWDAL